MSGEAMRRTWRDLDWVEELAYLALLGMEACVIFPWQWLVHAWLGHDGVPFWGLCTLTWAAYLVAGWLNRSALTADRKQAITAALVLISALVAIRLFVYPGYRIGQVGWIGQMANRLFTFEQIPAELLTILVVFTTWWRGLSAARQEYDTTQVWFHFRVGVVLLFVFLFISIFGQRSDTTLLLLGFFFFGLISIALARILELGGIHTDLGVITTR